MKGASLSIFTDCQSALAIARGEAVAHAGGIAAALGHVASCCRAAATSELVLQYVPGHAGDIGHEIADVIAKAAADGESFGGVLWNSPGDVPWWAGHGFLWSWAAVVCRWAKGDDALPPPTSVDLAENRHLAGLSADAILRPFLPKAESRPGLSSTGKLWFRLVSYNALSLATAKKGPVEEGLAFQPARPALLAAQLDRAGIHCAAIQEARAEEGHLVTRYCSGSAKGHFGVELWFRKNFPVLRFSPDCLCCSVFGSTPARSPLPAGELSDRFCLASRATQRYQRA